MNASSSPTGSRSESDGKGDYFATTRWTVVLKAGRKSSLDSDAALAELCRTYWYPLYVYVRRRGPSKEDAEDLVQGFFERFLAKNYLENVAADRGKFRAFLLASLKHYMSNEWDRASRQKRGGGVEMLSLDWVNAADRFQLEPEDSTHPEREYDRVWALALLGRVVQELRAECESEGKLELFDCAKGFLTATSESPSYELAGKASGLESGAVRVAVHRLRKRYRELLKRELMQTLSNPADLAGELRALLTAVS